MTDVLEHLPPDQLKPWAANARQHSKKQLRQLAESIRRFGFTSPVLIDETGTILAGHGRVEAAKLAGLPYVPCRRITNLSPALKRAYVIADNKLALNATWDEQLLADELQGLLETDFDVALTGFSIPEIDGLIEGLEPEEDGDPREDELPAPSDGPAVSQVGDLWQLGPHRLLCGDALRPESYATLLGDERAEMVFTDPPYNVPIDGHVGGSGAIKHREFVMASGEMSRAEFTMFLRTVFQNLAQHSVDGSIHFICMDWRHMGEVLAAGEAAYSELKNLITWVKDNGGMGTFYRSRHELIFAYKHGLAPHINSFELGQHGRKPHPILSRGTFNPAAFADCAARGWPVFTAIKDAAAARERMTAYYGALVAAGHDSETIRTAREWTSAGKAVHVADTDAQARSETEAFFAKNPSGAIARNSDDMICGSPDAVARQMRAFAEAGVGLMVCGFLIDLDNLPRLHKCVRLFKEEVIPRVAA